MAILACAAPEETEEVSVAAVEQKICPVMAGPIDKNIYTDYKGKRVYFCCQGRSPEFLAPHNSNLPSTARCAT